MKRTKKTSSLLTVTAAVAGVTMGASIAMELVGPLLEREMGFVGLAPWFLLDACLTGFLCCLSAAVMAFSYQRLGLEDSPSSGQDAAMPQPPQHP